MARLLVIVPDRISDIQTKGEYQPNYYNPGEVFDDVHILMMNDDRPDSVALQQTVGRAKLTLHNYPEDSSLPMRRPGFLRGRWLRHWAKGGIEIARRIQPDLIRCHGADWNTYLASRIKAKLGVPYVVSLHINPDVNPVRRFMTGELTPAQKLHNEFYEYLEGKALRGADLVMPVYKPILPYLARLGISRIEVCYNILDGRSLVRKQDYGLHRPPELVYLGRLIEEKNPGNIIRALAEIPNARFTIVGDGPSRPSLEALTQSLGLGDRVVFEPAVPNQKLCRRLPDFDIFVIHTEYWEISKSVLEALLTGLPCIINRRVGDPVPELQGDFVRLVESSIESYRTALIELLTDDAARATLGRRAYDHANQLWSPTVAEAKIVGIYRRLLTETARG